MAGSDRRNFRPAAHELPVRPGSGSASVWRGAVGSAPRLPWRGGVQGRNGSPGSTQREPAIKILKIVAIAFVAYVGIVVVFESLLGYFQPAGGSTLVITTFDEDGAPHERVVSRLESDGRLYVAANHWPRAWYSRALEQPQVQVTLASGTDAYRAVPVSAEGAEHARVDGENSLPVFFRILTGFPPRYFLRLDPRQPG